MAGSRVSIIGLLAFGAGLLSVLVNAFVLWTIPLLMIFGIVAAIIGLFLPFARQLLLYPIPPFLVYFQSVVTYFGQSDWILHLDSVPSVVWVGYYCLLACWVLLHKKK